MTKTTTLSTRAKPTTKESVSPAKRPTPRSVAKPAPASKPALVKSDAVKVKHKLVRDSFTIPKTEYAVLDALKLRAAKLGRPAKKSEVIRAGIAALNAMSDKALLGVFADVPSIKTGRPVSAKSDAGA